MRYKDNVERIILNISPVGECWEWQKSKTHSGYGHLALSIKGKVRYAYAHRVSYETFVGPIPSGLHIDHLCRNRACANPDHLEPVTMLENIRRGLHHVGRLNRTHCLKGHEYTKENTYIVKKKGQNPSRACRTCCIAAMKKYDHARRKPNKARQMTYSS